MYISTLSEYGSWSFTKVIINYFDFLLRRRVREVCVVLSLNFLQYISLIERIHYQVVLILASYKKVLLAPCRWSSKAQTTTMTNYNGHPESRLASNDSGLAHNQLVGVQYCIEFPYSLTWDLQLGREVWIISKHHVNPLAWWQISLRSFCFEQWRISFKLLEGKNRSVLPDPVCLVISFHLNIVGRNLISAPQNIFLDVTYIHYFNDIRLLQILT